MSPLLPALWPRSLLVQGQAPASLRPDTRAYFGRSKKGQRNPNRAAGTPTGLPE